MSDTEKQKTEAQRRASLISGFQPRTDLAVEEQESRGEESGKLRGVRVREWQHGERRIRLTEVAILDERGAKAMGKPVGTYLTLEAPELAKEDESYHQEASAELGEQLLSLVQKCCPDNPRPRILIAGLGNLQVTPDSLGPRVVEQLQMTRHLNMEYDPGFCRRNALPVLSGIVPGVMAQTGMETAEIIKGIVGQTGPDLLIAVDALAARSIRRLTATIQLTDTGIHPGSGVGNHRHSLTRESLGIPVIAIGVPTVVGAAAIVHDTVESMIQALSESEGTKGWGDYVQRLEPDEQYELIRELLEPQFGPMFVTPQDIDERVRRLSFTVSEGIHAALYRQNDTASAEA